MVIGSRFCNGNGQENPAYRKVGMRILDITTCIVGGISVTDRQSGFRAYGKRAIDCICIDDDGMSAGSEILLQAKDNKLKVEQVEIHCSYEVERASVHNPVSHGVKVLLILLQDMELLRTFYHGEQLSYGLTMLMILTTLVGSFMAFAGIIQHAISRLIDQSMKRMDASRRARAEPNRLGSVTHENCSGTGNSARGN